MRKYVFRTKVLSPVHISSGNKLTCLDYFVENGFVNEVDFEEFLRKLSFENIKELMRLIDTSIKGNRQVEENILSISNKMGVEDILRGCIINKYETNLENNYHKEISTFIKSNNKPFVPGSSFKGSLRSVLFFHELIKRGKDLNIIKENKCYNFDLLIKYNELIDLNSKKFIIRDSEFVRTVIYDSRRINIKKFNKKSKQTFTNAFEVIPIGEEFCLEVLTNSKLIDLIISASKKYYSELLKNKFNFNQNERLLPILRGLDDNSFLINIGFGGGVELKSVIGILERDVREKFVSENKREYEKGRVRINPKRFPSSKMVINTPKGFVDMGWVLVEVIE